MTALKPSKPAFLFAAEIFGFTAVFALVLAAAAVGPTTSQLRSASDGTMLVTFLLAFAIVTIVVLLLLRRHRGSRLFAVMLALAIFSGIASLAATLGGSATMILATSAALLLWSWPRRVWSFDLLLIFGVAGLAANLGLVLNPPVVAAVLAVLAVYDIVAVYWTRHMVEMGEALLRQRVFFAMIVPVETAGLWTPLSKVASGSGHQFIGTGDLILPALLVASVGRYGVAYGLFVGGGALLGIMVTTALFLSQKIRRPMPALPPIALGAIAGYAISLIIAN